MKFNKYTWNLYRNSPEGKAMIKYFSEADGYALFKKYCPHSVFHTEEEWKDSFDRNRYKKYYWTELKNLTCLMN